MTATTVRVFVPAHVYVSITIDGDDGDAAVDAAMAQARARLAGLELHDTVTDSTGADLDVDVYVDDAITVQLADIETEG